MTTPGSTPAAPPYDAPADRAGAAGPDQLVSSWLGLWNGDLDEAPVLLADDVQLHAARVDGVTDHGSQALVSWIVSMRGVMTDLRFGIEVGPFVDGDVVVVRWIATGHYSGGWPAATNPVGSPVRFSGTDILRVDQGRVAEYWLNTDLHVLLAQLGVGAS